MPYLENSRSDGSFSSTTKSILPVVLKQEKKQSVPLPSKKKAAIDVDSVLQKEAEKLPLECINLNAAGIDIGSRSHFVAVPPDRDPQPVQEFPAFTADLERLADWLERCGITTIAMESTGVYWIPIWPKY